MLLCPRCQRANPAEAAYCHFDGAELRANGRANGQQKRLPHEFVFPSGRRCQTYDELAIACLEEWDAARDLLGQGVFRQYLGSIGRTDLARAALETKVPSDGDIALDAFVNALPATIDRAPHLDLKPRRLNAGSLHVGETRQFRLTVINQGRGLLHGSVAVSEGTTWLRLGDGKGAAECAIKTVHEQAYALRIDTKGLAAPQKYAAKLTLITNGGIAEVPVTLDLAVHAFPKAPFQGAGSPREMAERMRTQPKQAVPLLESNEVARWFSINGWTYPVQGPTAKGVAAVQQFFEGMGLSKPPTVRIAESNLHLSIERGQRLEGQLTLRTEAKKWVYARAECPTPWLRILEPDSSGPQQAVLPFEVDATALTANQIHEARVQVTANAGQVLTARVSVDVRPPTVRQQSALAQPIVVGASAGLVLRLLLAIPADLYARVLARPGLNPPAGSFASWIAPPIAEPGFIMHFVLVSWWLGALLGAVILWRNSRRLADLVCGMLAGAVAGLVGAATGATLFSAIDLMPRLLWRGIAATFAMSQTTGPPVLWTIVWIAVAAFTWTVAGGMVGLLLGRLGPAGANLLARVCRWLSSGFRLVGLHRASAYFGVPSVP